MFLVIFQNLKTPIVSQMNVTYIRWQDLCQTINIEPKKFYRCATLLRIFRCDTFKSTISNSNTLLVSKVSVTVSSAFECVTTKDA